jgi:hypothetical protein
MFHSFHGSSTEYNKGKINMNTSKRFYLTLVIINAFCFLSTNSIAQVNDNNSENKPGSNLGLYASLAGGTWHSSTKWPDGTPFEVEIKYFWGPTKQALHFETYEPSDGKSVLIYEGVIYFDPSRNKIIQLNIKPNGDVNEFEARSISDDAIEVMGSKTKSIVRRISENEFDWELYIPDGNGWKQILNARHYRRL